MDQTAWVNDLIALQQARKNLWDQIKANPTGPQANTQQIQVLMLENLVNKHIDSIYTPETNALYDQYSNQKYSARWESIGGVWQNNVGAPPKFDTSTTNGLLGHALSKGSRLWSDFVGDAYAGFQSFVDQNKGDVRAACEYLVGEVGGDVVARVLRIPGNSPSVALQNETLGYLAGEATKNQAASLCDGILGPKISYPDLLTFDGIVYDTGFVAAAFEKSVIAPLAQNTEITQIVSNDGLPSGIITTLYVFGVYTHTVDTMINGQAVNVTYAYDASGSLIPHVNSINGQPPTNQAAADAALLQSGVGPGQLVNGDAGVSGTSVGGIVSTYDAAHPDGLQALTAALPTVIDALTLLKAIQSGDPLPITVSGLRLANDLLTAPTYTLSGAANVGSGILSLMSLDAALQRGDTLGALTSGAQTLSFGTQAYANLILDNTANLAGGSTQALYEFLNGNNTSIFTPDGVNFGNAGALSYLNLINSISSGDAAGTAINTLAIINPAVGAPIATAYAVFNMVTGLFGGSAPPEAWGNVSATWSGFNEREAANDRAWFSQRRAA